MTKETTPSVAEQADERAVVPAAELPVPKLMEYAANVLDWAANVHRLRESPCSAQEATEFANALRAASQAASHSAPAESKACASVGVEPAKCGIRYVGGFHSTWACDVCGHRDMHDAHPGCQHPSLASPAPSVGEPVAAFRALLRAEIDATIDASGDIARQEAQIDEADHLLVKFNELFPLATPPAAPAVTEGASDVLDAFEQDHLGFHLDHNAIQVWINKLREAIAAPAAAAPAVTAKMCEGCGIFPDGRVVPCCEDCPQHDHPAAVPEDPLQGAANWLKTGLVDVSVTDIQSRLLIGYNRARRLFDGAPASAVPESPAATNWKPIETAPKDGRDLLLRSLKGHVANGQWGQPAGWANPQCWVWPFINIEPAYWMEPLPEPRHD